MKNTAMMVMAMASAIGSGYTPPKRRGPEIDIEAEYKLIQNKQSNLSAAMHRGAVREYEARR